MKRKLNTIQSRTLYWQIISQQMILNFNLAHIIVIIETIDIRSHKLHVDTKANNSNPW